MPRKNVADYQHSDHCDDPPTVLGSRADHWSHAGVSAFHKSFNVTNSKIAPIRRTVSVKCCTSSGNRSRPRTLPFPVREPLLEDLVATELVVPDGGGDVTPVSPVVQVHVEGGVAQRRDGVGQRGPLIIGSVIALNGPCLGRA